MEWTYRSVKVWFHESAYKLVNVPRDIECALVHSLERDVAHFVTLTLSVDTVARGVMMPQKVGSWMQLLLKRVVVSDGAQGVTYRGWPIKDG